MLSFLDLAAPAVLVYLSAVLAPIPPSIALSSPYYESNKISLVDCRFLVYFALLIILFVGVPIPELHSEFFEVMGFLTIFCAY
jgi:hypothetical protein